MALRSSCVLEFGSTFVRGTALVQRLLDINLVLCKKAIINDNTKNLSVFIRNSNDSNLIDSG